MQTSVFSSNHRTNQRQNKIIQRIQLSWERWVQLFLLVSPEQEEFPGSPEASKTDAESGYVHSGFSSLSGVIQAAPTFPQTRSSIDSVLVSGQRDLWPRKGLAGFGGLWRLWAKTTVQSYRRDFPHLQTSPWKTSPLSLSPPLLCLRPLLNKSWGKFKLLSWPLVLQISVSLALRHQNSCFVLFAGGGLNAFQRLMGFSSCISL